MGDVAIHIDTENSMDERCEPQEHFQENGSNKDIYVVPGRDS